MFHGSLLATTRLMFAGPLIVGRGTGLIFCVSLKKMEHYFIFHTARKRTTDANRSGHAEQINLAGP
jgi:hypothetical protein